MSDVLLFHFVFSSESVNCAADGNGGNCSVGCGGCYLSYGFCAAVARGADAVGACAAVLACDDIALFVQGNDIGKGGVLRFKRLSRRKAPYN